MTPYRLVGRNSIWNEYFPFYPEAGGSFFVGNVFAYFQVTRGLNPEYRSVNYHVIENFIYTPFSHTLQTNV